MATAHKTHEHKGSSTLGVILNALNPFKKKSQSSSQNSRSEETHKSQPVARQATQNKQAQKPQGKAQRKPQKSAHSASAKKSHHKSHKKAQNPAVNTGIKAAETNAAGEHITSEDQAVMTGVHLDPAHAPGHRKMDVEGQFTEHTGEKTHVQKSALENNSRGDQAARLTSPQQRRQSPSRRASKRGNQMPKSTAQ